MWPMWTFLGIFDPTLWLFGLPAVIGIIAYDRGWYKGRRETKR